jgi:hypothetical protein
MPPSDRAAVVAAALRTIFTSSMSDSAKEYHAENLIRDEFADVERQAAADRTEVDE